MPHFFRRMLIADTRLISVKSAGETQSREPNRELTTPRTSGRVLSDDGRFVVLWSAASDLVDNDTNMIADLFLYDELTDRMSLISRGLDGNSADQRTRLAKLPAMVN